MIEIPVKQDPEDLYPKSFRLPKSLNDKLRDMAKATKRSENEVINLLIQLGTVADIGVK